MWEDHHRLFDLSQAKDRSQLPFLSHALSFHTAASREKMCFDYGDIRPETGFHCDAHKHTQSSQVNFTSCPNPLSLYSEPED